MLSPTLKRCTTWAGSMIFQRGMAGHSKWAKIKRAKGAEDQARAQIFAKIARHIKTALANGGNTTANLDLQNAIAKAKECRMPKEVIDRAILKAEMGKQGNNLRYEGVGPAGVAVIAMCVSDNNARTAAHIKEAFKNGNGSLGAPNSVAFKFNRVGQVFVAGVPSERAEELVEAAVEFGAEEVDQGDGEGDWVVQCAVDDLAKVAEGLRKAEFDASSTSITHVPITRVPVGEGEAREAVEKFLDEIGEVEDLDELVHDADL